MSSKGRERRTQRVKTAESPRDRGGYRQGSFAQAPRIRRITQEEVERAQEQAVFLKSEESRAGFLAASAYGRRFAAQGWADVTAWVAREYPMVFPENRADLIRSEYPVVSPGNRQHGPAHVLETITGGVPGEDPVCCDCSCGEEFECPEDPDSILEAFAAHVPGHWLVHRPDGGSLTGAWLEPA